mgnify:CR=1 FL=1
MILCRQLPIRARFTKVLTDFGDYPVSESMYTSLYDILFIYMRIFYSKEEVLSYLHPVLLGDGRRRGKNGNGAASQQRDKQDRKLPAGNHEIRQQAGTDRHLFPNCKGTAAHSRAMPGSGGTEEPTRRIVSLQPVEFRGRLYSKEYKENPG